MFVGTSRIVAEMTKRLATGRRLLGRSYTRFKVDDEQWLYFVSQLWRYWYTKKTPELQDRFFAKFHDLTQGVPAFAVALFALAQRRELFRSANGEGDETVNCDTLDEVYKEYFQSVDLVIKALRAEDEVALKALEDVPHRFSLEELLSKQTDRYLAEELNAIHRTIRRAGRDVKATIPDAFRRLHHRVVKSIEDEAQRASDSNRALTKTTEARKIG